VSYFKKIKKLKFAVNNIQLLKTIVMGKRKYLKIPILKWTWWQTTRAIVFVILAFRLKLNNEIIQLLKELIKLWSG